MIEDVHEPVDLYRTVFKAAHARHTAEFFETLVRQSGVDEQTNIKTVKDLRVLEQRVSDTTSSSKWWKILRIATVVLGVIFGLVGLSNKQPLWLIGVGGAAVLVMTKLNPLINDVDERLSLMKKQRDKKLEEARNQMAPLNALYDWDIVARLIRQTVPRLELDPYFANARLDELRKSFGWNDQFNRGRSAVFAHSGVLNGNPFVLAQTLNHWMGTKTYHGSLQISWTERVRDSSGNSTTVTRHETLHASVEKPFPEYGDRTIIIYGNEAAPDLSFSRSASKLSKLEDGMINNWRKGRAVKELEAKSRDIEKGSGFTVMANREFDALFGATDRDHEVQFRLLFTPLAQQEMLKLLKDREVGFGDDFEFKKRNMINFVEPTHMKGVDISADPATFQAYELAHARKVFNEYHTTFFKSFFFGLAPILVIPLYQQHRSHADIYKDVYGRTPCFWEHESIANYFGEGRFQHPECVTRNILKTQSTADADGVQTVRVTAHGYRGINRVTHVSVHGGDGRYHDVPVDWVEYTEVQHDSAIAVRETLPPHGGERVVDESAAWEAAFRNRGVEQRDAVLRRSIVSAVLAR